MKTTAVTLMAQADNAGDTLGGFVVIAICIGLCILMNQPKEKVTNYDFKGTKTERLR